MPVGPKPSIFRSISQTKSTAEMLSKTVLLILYIHFHCAHSPHFGVLQRLFQEKILLTSFFNSYKLQVAAAIIFLWRQK